MIEVTTLSAAVEVFRENLDTWVRLLQIIDPKVIHDYFSYRGYTISVRTNKRRGFIDIRHKHPKEVGEYSHPTAQFWDDIAVRLQAGEDVLLSLSGVQDRKLNRTKIMVALGRREIPFVGFQDGDSILLCPSDKRCGEWITGSRRKRRTP